MEPVVDLVIGGHLFRHLALDLFGEDGEAVAVRAEEIGQGEELPCSLVHGVDLDRLIPAGHHQGLVEAQGKNGLIVGGHGVGQVQVIVAQLPLKGGFMLILLDDGVGVRLDGGAQRVPAPLHRGNVDVGGGVAPVFLIGAEGEHTGDGPQDGHLLHSVGNAGAGIGQQHDSQHGRGGGQAGTPQEPVQPEDPGRLLPGRPGLPDGGADPLLQLRGDGDGVIFLFQIIETVLIHG